jgi:ubiquitin-conjugating enzyme E2 variant
MYYKLDSGEFLRSHLSVCARPDSLYDARQGRTRNFRATGEFRALKKGSRKSKQAGDGRIAANRSAARDCAPGMDTIESLGRKGVSVATGNGQPWQRATVNIVLLGGLALAVAQGVHNPAFLLALPIVLVAIDFLSGFVHWFFDTQVEPSDTPLGRIAVDFLDHHVRPGRTAEVGFYASAWRPALFVSLPFITVATLAPFPTFLSAPMFWIGWLSMLVPQTHKLTHMNVQSPLLLTLQRSRLIIHPSSHRAHHEDNRESFCVFTGWLNPVLDRTRFWRALEWLFSEVRKP